jgi:hypothetical protein
MDPKKGLLLLYDLVVFLAFVGFIAIIVGAAALLTLILEALIIK